jgi:hypothetical protein
MRLCKSINPIEVYEGRGIDIIPSILGEQRVPMAAFQLMRDRIDGARDFPDWEAYFFLSDLVAYSRNDLGKVKFILTVNKDGRVTENGRNVLGLINPGQVLKSGAIELGDRYDSFEGIEVSFGDIGRTGHHLKQDEILGSKAWRILARHPSEVPSEFAADPKLLEEYALWISSKTQNLENMAMYLEPLRDSPRLRTFYMQSVSYRSFASGMYFVDDKNGRFVGYLDKA